MGSAAIILISWELEGLGECGLECQDKMQDMVAVCGRAFRQDNVTRYSLTLSCHVMSGPRVTH